ncbi:hypothetical protein IscW_ISCW006184 [Ixodes scapularis]|uniref:Uncharacterized protein n=1 Tax=Ixodes scapularis TaxID=6945 RepID=B7PN64_IXOSC|nr:hypothetical protein IscW_ISCW006184 [Ixodes scapularis]|eukprot:XP_002435212.1 hypothetical protein IscW_ISCW006184 [Ixodes scapularis]
MLSRNDAARYYGARKESSTGWCADWCAHCRHPVVFTVREIKSKKVPEMLGRFAETILFFYL